MKLSKLTKIFWAVKIDLEGFINLEEHKVS